MRRHFDKALLVQLSSTVKNGVGLHDFWSMAKDTAHLVLPVAAVDTILRATEAPMTVKQEIVKVTGSFEIGQKMFGELRSSVT